MIRFWLLIWLLVIWLLVIWLLIIILGSRRCFDSEYPQLDIIKRLTYEHIDMGVELSLYGT